LGPYGVEQLGVVRADGGDGVLAEETGAALVGDTEAESTGMDGAGQWQQRRDLIGRWGVAESSTGSGWRDRGSVVSGGRNGGGTIPSSGLEARRCWVWLGMVTVVS
jgi:hypothetical protein